MREFSSNAGAPTKHGPARDCAGLTSISLRRMCLVLVVAALVWNALFQSSVEDATMWLVMLLIYGVMIAGAVHHVYRNVRVGRAESTVMILTTVVFAVAMLLAPRQVATGTRFVATHDTSGNDGLIIDPPPSGYHEQVSIEDAPLLRLFGHHPSATVEPWYALTLTLGIVTMIGVCVQWALVWRLGRKQAGTFNPAANP